MKHPRFITFEGIDGAGKSTHVQACVDWLRAQGQRVVLTREPGGSDLAEGIRHWLLNHEMTVQTEALLAFAARSDHLSRVIRPALAEGAWVLCDRFTDSTIAYQGPGLGAEGQRLSMLEDWVHGDLKPGRTYYFDLPPALAAERRAAVRQADRFEARDIEYFEQVRQGYHARIEADPGRFLVLDSRKPREVIATGLLADLAAFFRQRPMQEPLET
ncbi:MAG: dTMP kinase [Lautropia sp.]|nr:dTMP kinase [Lautropia sp.]